MSDSDNKKSRLLYHQDDFPVFQNRMYVTKEEALNCPKGDIRLVEDLDTGLVYNAAFDPGLMVYDEHYQNEQATSPLFQKHLERVADIVGRLLGNKDLVEVGCGKAYFLELLQSQGFEITGFDPAYEGVNLSVQKHYFQKGVDVQAKGMILRHVLEHVQHPVDFLRRLNDVNNNKGIIYIEVPCFDWIVENHVWFDIFYEHVNYFRLSDFYRMFDDVIETGKLFGGQYMYVVARLDSIKQPVFDVSDPVLLAAEFGHNIAKTNLTKPVVVWGGASKGVIFSLLTSRMEQAVDMVIDINPAKQGKYLPAAGLLVHSPKNAMEKLPEGSTVFVMNPNYIEEIKEMTMNKYNLVGVK